MAVLVNEGDIIYTLEGKPFKVDAVRLHGFSGQYLQGPKMGQSLFLGFGSFHDYNITDYVLKVKENQNVSLKTGETIKIATIGKTYITGYYLEGSKKGTTSTFSLTEFKPGDIFLWVNPECCDKLGIEV